MYKSSNWERFKTDYPCALREAVGNYPTEYTYGLAECDMVAHRMVTAIETKGIGGVNKDSRALTALTKAYGIKNTYKAWAAWLSGEG
jgi:hypothetical protein